jgi:hypothetical protein
MTVQTPEEIRRDLPDDLPHSESDLLIAIGTRLQAQRPVPAAAFRGELFRRLSGRRKSKDLRWQPTPDAVRLLAGLYVTAGVLLLVSAAVGLAGSGPFAPG